MKKIISLFTDFLFPKEDYIDYAIKCSHCGEIVKVKVFPSRDLNPTYEDDGPAYTLRKEVMDSKCFRIMVLTASFDSSRREIEKEISGGEFVGDN